MTPCFFDENLEEHWWRTIQFLTLVGCSGIVLNPSKFQFLMRLDLSLTWRVSEGPLNEVYGKPRKVSLPFGEAQLAECLRVQIGGPLEWDAGIQ